MSDTHQPPVIRPRRLRQSDYLRRMIRETFIKRDDLVLPLFVRATGDSPRPISTMPGQSQWPLSTLAEEAHRVAELGIPALILFGLPESKDACGSDNYNPQGVIARAIGLVKEAEPKLIVISDMCFCQYTDHGHCGVINKPGSNQYDEALPEGYLLNDATLDLLGRASVVHARAGADIIAPSGMIDGMVQRIRRDLDDAGFSSVSIMSYAAKYASAFYGPFRDAAESPPAFGDRRQYQMDPANAREAMREMQLDVDQGADFLMVKPALPYLDIISAARRIFDLPIAAYQVSGEYSMIQAAADQGWLDREQCVLESLTAIKRAGADLILTYFAREVARQLK